MWAFSPYIESKMVLWTFSFCPGDTSVAFPLFSQRYLAVCWAAVRQAMASSLSIDPRIVSCSHLRREFIKHLKLQYFISRCNVIKNTLSPWRSGIRRHVAARSIRVQRHGLRAVTAAFRGDVLTFASREQLCLYCTPPSTRSIPQVSVEETSDFIRRVQSERRPDS